MLTFANRGNILGQMNPFINPSMDLISTPSTPAASSGGNKPLAVGVSLLAAALAGTSTLFTYGLARDAKSKMVKTTGYVLAGVSALGTLVYLIGVPAALMMAGKNGR
jgi:hypothetical protein